MKKTIIPILSLLFLLLTILTGNEILMKIPVRVYRSGEYEKTLTIKDFDLSINGVKRKIAKVIAVGKSMNLPERSRTYILNFNMTEYGENIAKGIEYFVNNILGGRDNLMLWTPLKIYRIRSNQKKSRMISDMESLLKKDSLTYKNFRKGAKDKLIAILNKFLSSSDNGKDTGSLSTSIIFFLNNYSREWMDFKKKYIIPDLSKYYKLISMLTYKYPGDKYFINFQQREIMPSLRKYNVAKKIISDYLSSIAGTSESNTSSSISNAVHLIDRSMLLTDDFDPDMFESPFLSANISYNVIFFNSFRQTGRDSDDLSPDIEGVLRNLAHDTGGLSLNTNNLESGLNKLRKKKDFYYNMVFNFNGREEEKKIEIKVRGGKYYLAHLKKFHKEEIGNLIKLSTEQNIEIPELSLTGHTLGFTIKGFKLMGKDERTGIIRVKVELTDKDNNSLFSRAKTLVAKKESVKISLKLPDGLKGFFKLQVSAKDMRSSKNSSAEKYVELK